jgi:hypothetical protein
MNDCQKRKMAVFIFAGILSLGIAAAMIAVAGTVWTTPSGVCIAPHWFIQTALIAGLMGLINIARAVIEFGKGKRPPPLPPQR